MREIFSNSMVVHLWANKSQPRARNANKSLYFEGDLIFSYGRHFPLARHVELPSGTPAVLINRGKYSSTTSHHQSAVRGAIRNGVPVFRAHNPQETPEQNLVWLAQEMERSIEFAGDCVVNSQNYKKNLQEAEAAAKDHNTLAHAFGIKAKLQMPADVAKAVEDLAARKAAREAAEAERQRLLDEQRMKEEAATVAQWLAGEVSGIPWAVRNTSEVLLRVRDDVIETSKGAHIPLDHGIALWPLVERVRSRGRPADMQRVQLGGFRLDEINADGDVTVGCHFIAYAELRRIAEQLGLVKMAEAA